MIYKTKNPTNIPDCSIDLLKMEKNVNNRGKNECSLVTKSIIDQSCMKKETDKCRHFSIRAYVAEIREKDQTICWPFHSVGDSKVPQEQAYKLPPLDVAEFRWWSCQNCLWSTVSEEINCEGREPNFNTLADLADIEYYPVINLDTDGNCVDPMSSLRIDVFASEGSENCLVNKVDKGLSEPTSCETKHAQCLNDEGVGKDAEKTGLDFNVGQVDDPGETNCGICEVSEKEFANINSNCASSCSSETCSKRMVVCTFSNIAETSEQQREVITDVNKLEPVSVEREVFDSPTSSTSKLSSLTHAENNLTLTNNPIKLGSLKVNEDDEDDDARNNLDRSLSGELNNASRNLIYRKPRKVRLMTEILKSGFSEPSSEIHVSSGLVISNNIDSNGGKTDATDDNCNGFAVEKAIGKGTMKEKKKRKRFLVEEWGPHQLKLSNGGSKIVRNYENKHVGSVIASSATVNASYQGQNSGVGSEKKSHKRRVDELAHKIKKKDIMPHFDGRDGDRLETEKDTFTKPKDVIFPCNYENIIDIQGNPEVSEKQSIESANNMCESETLDGIPIEIVEFLAESRRHHRRFLEDENPKLNKIVSCPTRCSEAHHVCFPSAPFVINRNFEVPISKKKKKEQPYACVQKKIVKVNKKVTPTVFMVKSLEKHKSSSTCMKLPGRSTEICSVNRNPADFSIPGEIKKFMIRSRDLKPRKMVANGRKHSVTDAYGQETMRTMK